MDEEEVGQDGRSGRDEVCLFGMVGETAVNLFEVGGVGESERCCEASLGWAEI